MNWKNLCEYLYENINPQTGVLHSYAYNQYQGKQIINFYLEFDMNEFIYDDPFYGEQSSTSMFKTNFELMEITQRSLITDINEFGNLNITFEEKEKFGAFSNSLHLVPHKIKFRAMGLDKLNCEIEYSITNSDSYGLMDGSFEEHIQLSGTIKSELTIAELTINCTSEDELKKTISQLNHEVYDVNNIELLDESEYSKSYKIGYKKGLLSKNFDKPYSINLQNAKG
jgi:hypothetical protein